MANNEPFVYFPSNRFELEPVEIGLTEYPIQVYELYNGGDVPARVEIESTFVQELNETNYMTDILKCLSDELVEIPPGCSAETKWRFSPIEAKTYQVKILYLCFLKYSFIINKKKIYFYRLRWFLSSTRWNSTWSRSKWSDMISESSTIWAWTRNTSRYQRIKILCYQIRYNLNSSFYVEYYDFKSLFISTRKLATLSVDRLVFGNVPLFSRERKMVFIKNNSYEHKISFTWHVTNSEHIKV